jgi:hypothetical protein
VSGVYGKGVDIPAALSAVTVVGNKTVTLRVDGTPAGTAITDNFGNATFTVVGLNAGTHSISVSFAGDLDLTAAKAAATLTIAKAGVSLKWSTPNAIPYGTPLGSDQLNATATVPGTFTYTPAAGILLDAGTQTLLATFTPDDQQNYTNGEISVSFVVNKADQPTLSVVAPASLVYGTTVILSTTGGAGTGLVGISTGTSTGCAGAFSFVNVTNASGTCTVTATKGGDSNYNPVTSAPVVIALQKAAQGTLTVTAAPANAVFGSSFSVAATGGSGTGAITFAASEGCSNTAGASLITMTSGTGNCVITATKATDDNYLAAVSAAVLVSATTASSTSSLSLSVNQSTYGQPVTLTATVSSAAGTPSGTVTFADNAAAIGSSTLNSSGQATLTVTLAAGTHNLTVNYDGNTNFARSVSSPVSESIAKATTTTALTSTPNPSGIGQTVNFVATVTGQYGGAVTGTVTFNQGPNTILGTAPLVGGTATLSLSNLGSGPHVVTATYGGDNSSMGSTSSSVTQNVNAPTVGTTTFVVSSANPSVYGQSVNFIATVTPVPPGSGIPTGRVTFRLGQTLLGTSDLSNGQAQFSTSSLPAGSLGITAAYSGDKDFIASTSVTLNQVVNKVTTTSQLVSAQWNTNPSTPGDRVTFYVIVTATGVIPTGTVSLKENNATLYTAKPDANGIATFDWVNLSVGKHTLKAVYAGDVNTSNSTSNTYQQVVQVVR